jgi:hypothetical protein
MEFSATPGRSKLTTTASHHVPSVLTKLRVTTRVDAAGEGPPLNFYDRWVNLGDDVWCRSGRDGGNSAGEGERRR